MKHRFQRNRELELAQQTVSDEPRVRVNVENPDVSFLEWDEMGARVEYAKNYREEKRQTIQSAIKFFRIKTIECFRQIRDR